MNKLKKILAKLLRIQYVIVSIKDYNIANNKVVNSIYPGRNAFLMLEVPQSKILQFQRQANIREFVLVTVEQSNLIFEVVAVDYIYDMMTGRLVEMVIYSNLAK